MMNLKKLSLILLLSVAGSAFAQDKNAKYVLVMHGGAGTILKKNMTPEKEAAYRETMTKALQTGYDALKSGKSSLDAVEVAIHVLEDSPLFNAGKGAVFTHEGKNEMDAAIMDGKTLKAGAIAGVTVIRNPISAARAVMEKSEHVMMAGKGAEAFAKQAGLTIVDPSYFYTEDRWRGLQQAIKQDSMKAVLDHDKKAMKLGTINPDFKFGTVGAVALDQSGNLAAGTSTGGMTNKRYGRIGDAPIIGAGTYANNATAGVSGTGWGEFYIRTVLAHDLSAMMEYQKLSVQEASKKVIDKMGKLGGDGGLIALDKNGHVAMEFNTAGMYRGTVTEDGKISVEIYK
jgi:beta-aspartyl-peptidase (threonine type)